MARPVGHRRRSESYADNQVEAVAALRAALPQITAAVQALHTRLASSDTGRLVYIGAGTSARIGWTG